MFCNEVSGVCFMKKNVIKLVVAGVAVVSVVAYLMFTGLTQHSVYFLEVSELLKNPTTYDNKNARLSGDVIQESVVKGGALNAKALRFAISDEEGSSVFVEYSGVVPDAFYDENAVVILEGTFKAETTTFYAETLMAKCPSKYEGEDPAEHNAATAADEKSSQSI